MVQVSDYYIGQTEVTQELWDAVMNSNPSSFSGSSKPVERVSWEDCKEFINRLNALTGQQFRLPTEAEWEFAARGGNKSRGYKYAGSNDWKSVAWLGEGGGAAMNSVASKSPNELGLYDMSGNVWEFCADWYRKTPDGKPSRFFHVIRGGAYDCSPRYSRVTNRFMYDERRRRMEVGFRLAMDVR
jgi:formylglycine-generating enzyme required for sulfatase activity